MIKVIKLIVQRMLTVLSVPLKVILIGTVCAATVYAQSHIWLHVDGKYIKNSRNKIFMGVGQAVHVGNNYGGDFTDDFARFIKLHGSNCVRLSMSDEIDQIDLNQMDAAVAAFVADGLGEF